MDPFESLSHLTRPEVEELTIFQQQPPCTGTRYIVKCHDLATVGASDAQVQTLTWFKTPPLTAETIRMIRAVKLFAESHDQGWIDDLDEGNWTWFQLVIFSDAEATSPKKDRDGKEFSVTSHTNRPANNQFEWREGATFDTRRSLVKGLEPGNVIGVRLCARFPSWKNFARNGYLVIEIGEDNRPVPLTPITINSDESIPPRRNVKAWYDNAKTDHKVGLEVSLFIRAMMAFQRLLPENQLSYYRIAGIHAYPYNVPWNENKSPVPLDDPDKDGRLKRGEGGWYCAHNQDLFPTWHRAYMMLFERRVSDLMMDEAVTRKNETEEWVLAAKRWRLPYWDWAVDPRLPDLASGETIRVIKSWNGRNEPYMEDLENPMYRFQMPGFKPMGDDAYGNYRIDNKEQGPWEQCIGTSRRSISIRDAQRRWVYGVSNAAGVNAALAGPQDQLYNRTLKDAIYRLLTENYSTKYVRFASTRFDSEQETTAKGYLNLEAIHNTVHDLIGGSDDIPGRGHMGSVPVAAFDPIFWMHHCNVDRLFHLWQSANPSSWFHQKPGQVVDRSPQQPLRPFHVSSELNDYYNSNQVRHSDALNYTYDYVDRITDEFGDMVPEKSHVYINQLYGPPEKAFGYQKEELDPVINVIYDRYAFGGKAYSLLFFLGDVDHKIPYKQQTSLIGTIFTFTAVSTENAVTCKACYAQQRDNVLSRAQLPITTVVPNVERENPGKLIAYLRKKLTWIAVHEDGVLANKQKLTTLKIKLSCGVNQLVEVEKGYQSSFKFGKYETLEFNWDNAYALNSRT